MRNNSLVAVVIADDHYNGLGVIRSLGEEGVPIILILLNTGKTIIDHSRYVTKTIKTEHNREAILNVLNSVLSDDKYFALFPLSDYVAEVLDEVYQQFPQNVITPHAGGNMRKLMDKYILSEMFRSCGVTVPNHIVFSMDEKKIPWETFPAIVKPLASVEGLKSDIATVHDKTELVNELATLKRKGYSQVLVEEFITGKDEFMIEILGYMDLNGNPHFSNVVHKIREYPLQNGSTAFAYFEENPGYINFECLKKAVQFTGHTGIFDIEFKFGNGRAYFIEMNFRNGAPSYAVTRKGLNIPYEWLCARTGIGAPPKRRISNKKYFMCEHRDVLNMLKKNVAIIKWLRDYYVSDKIIWNWKDLIPSGKLYGGVLKTAVRRLVHG